MSDDFTRIDLPSGASLWYRDHDHYYAAHNEKTGKKGKRLTGVTTVCKVGELDPSKLMEWSARTNCIGVAELFAMQGIGSWLDSGEAIWEELVAHYLTYEDVRDRASTRGTNVHRLAFEALAHGADIPHFDALTEEERGHAQAITAFWLDHAPQFQAVEQAMLDPELSIAGRLDGLGTIKGYVDPGVIDVKTGYVGEAAHLQVAGYRHLAKVSGFGDARWAKILKTREDGTYELVDVEAGPDDFLAAVDMYRRITRIKRDASRARKARA